MTTLVRDLPLMIIFNKIWLIIVQCQSLAEKYEHLLENWFFKLQNKEPSLEKHFCVDAIQSCCLTGYFGEECSPCPGLQKSKSPCYGRGNCEVFSSILLWDIQLTIFIGVWISHWQWNMFLCRWIRWKYVQQLCLRLVSRIKEWNVFGMQTYYLYKLDM